MKQVHSPTNFSTQSAPRRWRNLRRTGLLLAFLTVLPAAECADSMKFRSYTRDDGSAPQQFQPTESDGQGAYDGGGGY